MAGRNEYLDFSKGLLILLVVIGHSIQCVAYQGANFWDDPFFKAIYMFHMPLFMAISGYVSTPSLVSIKPIALIRAKASSYFTPIIAWTVLYLLLLCVRKNELPPESVMLGEFLERLWFLWVVFASLILASVARLFGKFWAAASAVMFAALLAVPDISILHLFKYTYPFFLLGHAAALKNNKPTSSFGNAVLVGATAICSVVCFILWHEETYIYVSKMALISENLPNIVLRYVAGVTASILALYLFYYGFRLVSARFRNMVNKAGSDSIYIYIVSSYIFIFAQKMAGKYFSSTRGGLIAAIIGLAAGVSITYISWVIGKLISANPFAARLLFGKKPKPKKQAIELAEAKSAR